MIKIDINKFRELVKNDFEEFEGISDKSCEIMFYDTNIQRWRYFKPKHKFPVVFEGEWYIFSVYEKGEILILNNDNKIIHSKYLHIQFDKDFIALYQAIELSKKLREKTAN